MYTLHSPVILDTTDVGTYIVIALEKDIIFSKFPYILFPQRYDHDVLLLLFVGNIQFGMAFL